MTAARTTDPEPVELELVEPISSERQRRLASVQLPAWLSVTSPAMIWIGLVLAGVGFILIGVAWSQVAGETQVYLQLPYLVSAGFTGVALIMVGLTVINVSAKRRDALERGRQMDQLVSILEEVKSVFGERGGRRK